jgi:cytochrome b561
MILRNTRESWGGVAKTLHWSAAAVVFVMLGLGLTMVHGDLGAGAKFEAYQLHKSTGFLVLAVMLVRGLWRIANPPPAPPAGTRPWERRLARALHHVLYVLILSMIESGWLMVRRRRCRFKYTFPAASCAQSHRPNARWRRACP